MVRFTRHRVGPELHHLHRALSILEAAGVDRVVCLGDVVEGGPHPDAVVELLERLCIPTVQGNHDLNAVRHAALEIDDRGMSLDTLAWLDALPRTRQYEWEGKRIAMAHASLGEGYPGVRPDDVPSLAAAGDLARGLLDAHRRASRARWHVAVSTSDHAHLRIVNRQSLTGLARDRMLVPPT